MKIQLRSKPNSCAPGPNQVAFFINPNYDPGACVVKGLGLYENSHVIGLKDNKISSIKVGSNVQVKAYEHPNFKGYNVVFGEDAYSQRISRSLVHTPLNDKISSVSIQKRSLLPQNLKPYQSYLPPGHVEGTERSWSWRKTKNVEESRRWSAEYTAHIRKSQVKDVGHTIKDNRAAYCQDHRAKPVKVKCVLQCYYNNKGPYKCDQGVTSGTTVRFQNVIKRAPIGPVIRPDRHGVRCSIKINRRLVPRMTGTNSPYELSVLVKAATQCKR